jgi:hypothetical protein
MTEQEMKDYILQERIKAYIYFGVEAEMEFITNRIEKSLLDPEEEKNIHEIEWYDKYHKIYDAKIERANKRIEELRVFGYSGGT